MFVAKTQREGDAAVINARKDALFEIKSPKKIELIQESIRLKDGIGNQAFICISCKANFTSLDQVDEHIRTKDHAVNRACATLGLRFSHDLFSELSAPNRPLNLDQIIQQSPSSIQFIGLGSITEYADPDGMRPPVYECSICQQRATLVTIKAHLLGYQHMYNYLVSYEDPDAPNFKQRNIETETKIIEKMKSMPPNIQTHRVVQSIPTWAKDLKRGSGETGELPSTESLRSFGLDLNRDNVLEPLFRIKIEDDSQQLKVIETITKLTESLVGYKMKHFSRDIVDSLIENIRKEADPRRFEPPSIKLG